MTTASEEPLTREEALRILREHQAELVERFGVRELALFGSTVRNEARPDSDVDLLADFAEGCDWQDRDEASAFLQNLFGRQVDLVSRPELFGKVRAWVEREELPVFNPPANWSLPVPLEKRWDMYVDDMLRACDLVLEFTDGFELDDVLGDDLRYSGTLYRLQTIGEAANKIPSDVYARHPEIPWRDMINARNWIAHGYDAIDPKLFWKMLTASVPELIPKLRVLREEAVAELPPEIRAAEDGQTA